MERQDAYNQMITILKSTITVPEDVQLTENTSLRDDLGMDSLGSLTFLMELEESIDGFSINPESLEERHFSSIGAMVDYIVDNVALETAA
ncbi:Acyl carrier protein [Grimontia celer]|uniref:Acyl carrier protein n=1 Tax=Grimontia celer TaxID=1796497 RepID=A0A128F266_9GAMM|nr:phosphopantetheine-binding protein [Grimontia celer]CZF80883.1 Acyl carrier protein [Grimontia celer]